MDTILSTIKRSLVFLFCLTIISACNRSSHDDHDHHHGHAEIDNDEHHDEQARGPHGGRLLTDGDFSLELKIFETGVPPQYRVYAYKNGDQISAKDYSVTVILSRLGGRIDKFIFQPVADFLTSDKEVEEPHSFDVEVNAEYGGKKYSWSFDSYEGRTTILDEMAKRSGIKTEKAKTNKIKTTIRTRGKILPTEYNIAHIIPRFSGLVREARKHIGDSVKKGEVLAIIESNESLQPFEVRSQISGTIINSHLTLGEFIPENQWIYIVADLSEVWVDLFVPLRERASIEKGQKVFITAINREDKIDEIIEGVVSYIAPYADEKSQSRLVRCVISNKDNQLLPGMFVTGDIVVSDKKVDVAVKKNALQSFRDWTVVFVKVGSTYEIKPLTLGVTDGEWVEVVEGLTLGEEYVTKNAFLIKADILKSGASHDH